MSKYTTELRYILETMSGLDSSVNYPNVNSVIEQGRSKLFSFKYPIFDESYREHLESLICLHYYRREIGFETVGLFKLYLERKMREIMPYYNQLYKSELLEFNPFYDIDLTKESKNDHSGKDEYSKKTESNSSGKTSSNIDNINKVVDNSNEGVSSRDDSKSSASNKSDSSSTNNNKQRYSDTPQGSISDLEQDKYLTNATITDGIVKDTSTASGSDESTTTHTSNVGKESTTDTTNKETSNGTNENATNGSENGNSNNSSIDNYLEHVKGKQGGASYASLLKEYRETFLNIDMLVIKELNDLFMLLW